MNPDVDMYKYEVPAVVTGGRVQTFIYDYTEGVKVVVRCEGCCWGKRHYRKCTPKTLQQKNALHCRVCMVLAQQPVPHGVRMPPVTEQRFMSVLCQLGLDEHFMFQVVPPFWPHPMDFCCYVSGYYVQVDGSRHWTDTFKEDCEKVLAADFEQACSALNDEGVLLRVHEADLGCIGVVAEALAAAVNHGGVVLSPSYAHQVVPYQGSKLLYMDALQCAVGRLRMTTYSSGITCIQWM